MGRGGSDLDALLAPSVNSRPSQGLGMLLPELGELEEFSSARPLPAKLVLPDRSVLLIGANHPQSRRFAQGLVLASEGRPATFLTSDQLPSDAEGDGWSAASEISDLVMNALSENRPVVAQSDTALRYFAFLAKEARENFVAPTYGVILESSLEEETVGTSELSTRDIAAAREVQLQSSEGWLGIARASNDETWNDWKQVLFSRARAQPHLT